jgi:hypothetical protein
MDLSAALVVALIVYVWRALRRGRGSWSGPIPDVGTPPPDAEPIAQPNLNDDGLVTYSLVFSAPSRGRRSETARHRI